MRCALTRRRFVRLAAALAAPAVIKSSALGADGAVSPANRITVGCIGVGGQGLANMRNFLSQNAARVLAVCDCYEDRRRRAKAVVDKNYGDESCAEYADFRELIQRKDIDAVCISTQDHWHAVIAIAAARAGKDMYLEKPLGVSVQECQAIRDAVIAAGTVFQTGTQQRSSRNFRFACELARNGYLGNLHAVEVATEGPNFRPSYRGPLDPQPVPPGFDWEMWLGPAPAAPYNPGRVAWPDWYLIWDYCAGFIVNWGVHHLDIACWGCPAIVAGPFEVECQATYRNEGFTDNVDRWRAVFTCAGGLKMVFSDHFQQKLGCRFIGDKGWVHVDRAGIWADPPSLLRLQLKADDLHLHESVSHHGDFLKAVRSRGNPVSDIRSGHVASYLGMLADIAARLGRKLKWDPAAEKFVGDEQANRMLGRPMRQPWRL